MGEFRTFVAAAVAAGGLAACAAVPSLVGATSQAALAPVSNIAQAMNYGLQTIDHTVGTVATSARTTSTTLASSSQIVSNTATDLQGVPVAMPTTSYQAPSLTKAQKDAIEKARKAPQPELPVLPKETLDSLSVDQRGLQDAAQREALNGPLGETLFWDNEGRSGTAVAEAEHMFGDARCRAFIETVTIDGKTIEGRATACKDDDKSRWMLAF
jgi:hypothetical protein